MLIGDVIGVVGSHDMLRGFRLDLFGKGFQFVCSSSQFCMDYGKNVNWQLVRVARLAFILIDFVTVLSK